MLVSDSFKNFLLYSLLAHFLIVIFFVIDPNFNLFPKEHIVIREAIRVDSIGLPDLQKRIVSAPPKPKPRPVMKKKAPKPVVKKKAKAKPKPKPAKPPALEKIKAQQKSALEKLQALESLDNIKREVKEKPEYKGARLSKGSSPTGSETLQFEMLKYFTSLKSHIKIFWSLPQELASQNLRAEIYVEIGLDGSVFKKQIMQSSGSAAFDARVLEALDRASPFPAPPKEVQKQLSQGVVFRFPE